VDGVNSERGWCSQHRWGGVKAATWTRRLNMYIGIGTVVVIIVILILLRVLGVF